MDEGFSFLCLTRATANKTAAAPIIAASKEVLIAAQPDSVPDHRVPAAAETELKI